MSNVVSLHGDKRWRAVIEYDSKNGPVSTEHFFEEMRDLHVIVEHGPDWNTLARCTVTLNRPDGGEEQNSVGMGRRDERQ